MGENEKEVFEWACVRLARNFGLEVNIYEDIPEHLRHFCEFIGYKNVVAPAVRNEYRNGSTIGRLAIKYRLSVMQVRTILKKN